MKNVDGLYFKNRREFTELPSHKKFLINNLKEESQSRNFLNFKEL